MSYISAALLNNKLQVCFLFGLTRMKPGLPHLLSQIHLSATISLVLYASRTLNLPSVHTFRPAGATTR